MASKNGATQHAPGEIQDADFDNYKSMLKLEQPSPLAGAKFSPISFSLPSTEKQQLVAYEGLEPSNTRRRKQQTQRLEFTPPFNFVLPSDYVPINDELTKLLSLGHEMWQPLAERLTGWRKEVRCRVSGMHDTFYYHGQKKFKSFSDARRFIYLGYPPSDDNGDGPLKILALKQPKPMEEGALSDSAASSNDSQLDSSTS